MGWWRNLSNLGLEPEAERGRVRRAQMTNRMIFISIFLGFSYVPMYLSFGSYEPLVQNLMLTVFSALLFILSAKGRHEVAAVLLCCLLLIHIISVSILIQGGTGRFYLIEIAVLGFTMLRRVRVSIVIFIVSLLAFFVCEYAHLFFAPVISRSADDNIIVYTFNITCIFLGGLYLIFHLKRTNDYYERDVLFQQRKIQEQHQQLEASHNEIKDSITYAKRIQQAILPTDRFIREHIADSFVLYLPKDIVAGDFYWMESCANASDSEGSARTLLFAACDCTGHGVPGAMVSVICNNALNRSVREYGLTSPGKILDKTREIIISEFEKSDLKVNDGMDIAMIAVQTNQQGEITSVKFAGANNPLWLIRNKELIEFRGDPQPVSAYHKMSAFTTQDIPVKKGDTLYLCTDGYSDQFGGAADDKPLGKKFSANRFRELLRSLDDADLETRKQKLLDAFENWRGDLEQIDDVCIIGVKI
jgi:serine phosphatase RsbU (regulator of sigma subunit)